MSKDRIVQLVALVIAAVSLLGAALLVPTVNRQRRDLQLTFDIGAGDQVKPSYAVLAAGLGSFKGLAVNALWYRVEQEKRAGRYAEANNLSTWITELQPRFPQVWAFQAWNMAYNISVATFTPQERWDWINKAIHLLREEGIRYNPQSVRLYRELAWTLFHKVGAYSDDMNWYYKAEVAREWHEVFGGPADFLNEEGVVANMGVIAAMADRYLMFDRPSQAARDQLTALAADIAPIADDLDQLHRTPLLRLITRLEKIQNTLASQHLDESAERVGELLASLRKTRRRAERDPLAVFQEDNPQATTAIAALRDAGFEMDVIALRAIGKLRMYAKYGPPDWIVQLPDPLMDSDARRMADVFFSNNSDPFRDSLRLLLPFLRAKVLHDHYNMDPAFMHQAMLDNGPLDWRHPNSHALYWAAKGLDVATGLRNDNGVDWVNTQRIVIHAIQSLTDYGSVSFNPLLPAGSQVDLMPNPAFADSYGRSLKQAIADAQAGKFGQISIDSFESGHENFLHKAIYLSYFYGEEAKAHAHYQELRELYGDKYHNQRESRYEQPLQDLIWEFVQEDMQSAAMARAFFASSLHRAFLKGLARDRLNFFNITLIRTQEVYDRYQKERSYETGLETRNRLALPPFNQMVFDGFTRFMQDASIDLIARQNAYHNAPLPLLQQTYPRWIGNVEQQLTSAPGAPGTPSVANMFPEPPGLTPPEQPTQGQIDGVTTERK